MATDFVYEQQHSVLIWILVPQGPGQQQDLCCIPAYKIDAMKLSRPKALSVPKTVHAVCAVVCETERPSPKNLTSVAQMEHQKFTMR